MKIGIIAAVSRNGVIGKNGRLPWHNKDDLSYFKSTTSRNIMIFGRRTWESVSGIKPRGRAILVVSTTLPPGPGYHVFPSLPHALEYAMVRYHGKEAWVCGGAELYREAFDVADIMKITRIDEDVAGDDLTMFPEFDIDQWPHYCSKSYKSLHIDMYVRKGGLFAV